MRIWSSSGSVNVTIDEFNRLLYVFADTPLKIFKVLETLNFKLYLLSFFNNSLFNNVFFADRTLTYYINCTQLTSTIKSNLWNRLKKFCYFVLLNN